MTLRRFFVERLSAEGGSVVLSREATEHVQVLRLQEGDQLILFDGSGRQARAHIDAFTDGRAVCQSEPASEHPIDAPDVVLLLAVPKGSKVDTAVRMATEFGVTDVHLLTTEHSVPTWPSARVAQKLERLGRVAVQAARQSGQVRPSRVHPPRTISEAISTLNEDDQRLVFSVRAEHRVAEFPDRLGRLVLAVGPEGGFSDAELDLLCLNRFAEASLGSSVLRVDTALAGALGIVADRLLEAKKQR